MIADITTDDGETIRYTMSTVTLMRVIEGGTATISQNLGFALADVLCKAPARGH